MTQTLRLLHPLTCLFFLCFFPRFFCPLLCDFARQPSSRASRSTEAAPCCQSCIHYGYRKTTSLHSCCSVPHPNSDCIDPCKQAEWSPDFHIRRKCVGNSISIKVFCTIKGKKLIRNYYSTLPLSQYHTYHRYAFSTLGDRCVYTHLVMLLARSDTAVIVFFPTPRLASSVFGRQWLMESHETVLLFTKGLAKLIRQR